MNTLLCQRLSCHSVRQIYTGLCRNFKSSTIQNKDVKYKLTEQENIRTKRVRSGLLYGAGVGVLCLGLAYAAVPLYRVFCQAYSYGGTVGHDDSKVDTLKPVRDRIFTVSFNADTATSMRWSFRPQQAHVKVAPGETALVFYTAKNPLNVPVVGISTYNVIPFDAGQYFNKIQCFCFEEQQLNPHEEVDLPVFFYIDPEIVDDPNMENIDEIMLSYTFFEVPDAHITMPSNMPPTIAPTTAPTTASTTASTIASTIASTASNNSQAA